MLRTTAGLGILLAMVTGAWAQRPPQFYGVYAIQNGALSKLEGKPVSGLGLGIVSGIVRHPPTQTFPDGGVQFVIYRRDLAISAPQSVFVNIVAKIAVEKMIGMRGEITGIKPISGVWNLRNRGYEFLVAPYGDNREMILVRHQNDNFKIPDGRYAFVFGTDYYDFLVGKESSNLEHCVEWHATVNGVNFPQCTTPPQQAALPPQVRQQKKINVDPNDIVKIERSSPERKAILDVVRASVERKLGIKVIFEVRRLAVYRNWAFVELRPRTEAGTRIDYKKTLYAKNYHRDMDSDLVDVLLRRDGASWSIAEEAFLPTDVITEDWEKKYELPSELFTIG